MGSRKKSILLVILLFLSAYSFAIDVGNNFSINGCARITNAYIYRSDRLADISFQPQLSVRYDSHYGGSVEVLNWWEVGKSINGRDLFTECDLKLTYYSPENIIKISGAYFNYLGYRKWQPQFELELSFGGGDFFPLYVSFATLVYDKNTNNVPYRTYFGIKYDIELENDWYITPEFGLLFGLKYRVDGYAGDAFKQVEEKKDVYVKNISIKVLKDFPMGDYCLFVDGGLFCNLYDSPEQVLEYQKNINLNIACGIKF